MEKYSLQQNHTSTKINKEMQAVIEDCGIARSFSKGSIIYRQGDMAENFYYLKKGRVKVFMTSVDGMEKTLNTALQGEILGEGAFFDKQPRVSSAGALTNAELIMINKEQLTELIKKHPKLAFELLEILANRIRLLSAQLDSMTFMQADARIAQLLLECEQNGRVTLTHEEIANSVGVSRVTVSKTLGDFAKAGIIQTEYRCIIIKDKKALDKQQSW